MKPQHPVHPIGKKNTEISLNCERVRPPRGNGGWGDLAGLKLHIRTIDAACPVFLNSLEQYSLYVASMTLQGDSETRAGGRRCRHSHRSDGRRLRLESRVQHINPMCVYSDVGGSCLITHVRMCERRGGGGDGGGGRIGDRKWIHMLGRGTRLLLTSLTCYNTLHVCSTGSYWL